MGVDCGKLGFVLRILAKLVYYVRIIVPIILIVMIIIDLAKVVVNGNADDKAKRDAFSKAVKRTIYAVLVFLIPVLINYIFKKVEDFTTDNGGSSTTSTSWVSCWRQYYNGN